MSPILPCISKVLSKSFAGRVFVLRSNVTSAIKHKACMISATVSKAWKMNNKKTLIQVEGWIMEGKILQNGCKFSRLEDATDNKSTYSATLQKEKTWLCFWQGNVIELCWWPFPAGQSLPLHPVRGEQPHTLCTDVPRHHRDAADLEQLGALVIVSSSNSEVPKRRGNA